MTCRRHGESAGGPKPSVEYRIWTGMVNRCTNVHNRTFPRYGGRGIGVCLRWMQYECFLADMGRRPSATHSLDRIDYNGSYTPDNVRWATPTEQARNRRHLRPLTIDGQTRLLCEWSDLTGVPIKTIWARVYEQGWLPAKAVYTPVRHGRVSYCKNGHPLSGANVRFEGSSRRCRTCKREYDAAYRRAS